LGHPLRLVLAVTGVALGVAVFVGVELANDSARRAFAETESQLVGRATHSIVGVGGEIPNTLYRSLRRDYGPVIAAPIVEVRVYLPNRTDESLVLLGVDPVEETDFRDYSGAAVPTESSLFALMSSVDRILVPQALARELELDLGAELELAPDGGQPMTVTVSGYVDDSVTATEQANLPLVADIATAQALTGRNTLTRIDLILSDDEARGIEALGLPGVTLQPAASRSAVFAELSRAFATNLTALSLLALLVGIFLIYATISFAVLQRRHEFGIHRALGTPRRTLLTSVLIEGALLGAIAGLIGLALGEALSRQLTELVLRTIGDLYFSTSVRAVDPHLGLYARGLAVAIATSTVAAVLPALEATRVPPRTAMSRASLERSSRKISIFAALLALPCAAVGLLAIQLAPRSLTGAFAGLFLIILAAALAIPFTAGLLLRTIEPGLRFVFGLPGALAVRGVTATLSRTGIATAALAVAIGTVIGIGLMIASFRVSVEEWLGATLLADFYVEADGIDVSADDVLATPEIERLATLAGIRGFSLLQFDRLPTEQGLLSVRAVRPGPDGWGLTIVEPVDDDLLERVAAGDGVLVSEALAYRRELGVGDDLELPTQSGPSQFTVLGIYREYNTDGGGVLLPISEYQRHWNDREIDGIGLYLDRNVERRDFGGAIRTALTSAPDSIVRSTQAIRDRSLDVFDRTFRITEVLRGLAAIVAFFGLLSALLSIELERAKEIAVLRALGLSPLQIGQLSLVQTTLLGIAAGVLAIPLGIVMAELLVDVINRRSFGWGMELGVTVAPIAVGATLAVLAAVLAGVYPALRLSRGSIVAGLREE
jgi:putative ABC transport system permease protein